MRTPNGLLRYGAAALVLAMLGFVAGAALQATGALHILALVPGSGRPVQEDSRQGRSASAPAGKGDASAAEPWLADDFKSARPQLESHLRGLDVAMIEIGYRFSEMHFGGRDRNWPYVTYQLDKIELAMHQALERRPQRAESAGPFLDEVLPAVREGIHAAIESRDQKPFQDAMERLRTGCTQCHVREDVPHFTVTFPTQRVSCIGPTS
jgi:hypothetical protein